MRSYNAGRIGGNMQKASIYFHTLITLVFIFTILIHV